MNRWMLRVVVGLFAVALTLGTRAQGAPAASGPVVLPNFVAISGTADGQHLFGRLPGALGGEPLGTVPILGGAFVPLVEPTVTRYQVSPTLDWVVFQGTPVGNPNPVYEDSFRYWSVPILGGTPVPLSEPTMSIDYPSAPWKFSSDGQRLTYLEPKALMMNPDVLKARRVDGSGPAVVLSPDTGRVMQWAISPNNQWVVMWVGDSATSEINTRRAKWSIVNSRLMAVPLVGPKSSTVTLDSTPGATGVYAGYAFSPDGTRLVYSLNGAVWSVDLSSGSKTRLSPLGFAFNDDYSHIQVTSDSSRAIWDAGLTGPVFSTPVTGPDGASVNLSAALPGPIYNSGLEWSWQAPSSGTYVVMRTGNSVFSVPATGSGAAVLLTDGGSNGVGYQLTADRLLFWSGAGVYSIPLSASKGSEVQVLARAGGDGYLISPDGAVVVGQLSRSPRLDVFSVPITGPSQMARNESYAMAAVGLGQFYTWQITPDSRYIVIPDVNFTLTHVFTIGSGPLTMRLSSDCNSAGNGETAVPAPTQTHQLFLASVGRCILTSSSP